MISLTKKSESIILCNHYTVNLKSKTLYEPPHFLFEIRPIVPEVLANTQSTWNKKLYFTWFFGYYLPTLISPTMHVQSSLTSAAQALSPPNVCPLQLCDSILAFFLVVLFLLGQTDSHFSNSEPKRFKEEGCLALALSLTPNMKENSVADLARWGDHRYHDPPPHFCKKSSFLIQPTKVLCCSDGYDDSRSRSVSGSPPSLIQL